MRLCVRVCALTCWGPWVDAQEDLTPESTVALLETLKAGKTPKVGPQTGGRKNCEGPQGKTTLFAAPAGPFCRDLETA